MSMRCLLDVADGLGETALIWWTACWADGLQTAFGVSLKAARSPRLLPTERRCRPMALNGLTSLELQNATTGTTGSTITSLTPMSSCCRQYIRLATLHGPSA